MDWSCECRFCDKEIEDNEKFYFIYGLYLHLKCRPIAEKKIAANRDWELLTALDCSIVQKMSHEYRLKQLEKMKQNEIRL